MGTFYSVRFGRRGWKWLAVAIRRVSVVFG
jgi:hypothetical protein